MKRYPAGAGCDDDPRRGWDRRRGDVPDWAVVVPFFCRRPQRLFADARRSISPRRTVESVGLVGYPNTGGIACDRATELTVRATELTVPSHLAWGCDKWTELGTEAAEILISASGGGPAASGEAAATSERSERKRHAVRSRGGRGRGAESAGWREVAEWCRATEGSGHE